MEGLPADWSDLYRLAPPGPIEDNAAVDYAQGFAAIRQAGALKGSDADRLLGSFADGTANPEEVMKLRQTLAAYGPGLAKVREGARRKGYSFGRRWEKGAGLLFPEFADARTVVRALVLRAVLARDPAAAQADLVAAARVSADVGSEPVLISPFVGLASESTVHRGLRIVGSRGGVWAAAVRPAITALGPVTDLRRALAGEAVFARKFADDLAKNGPEGYLPGAGADDHSAPLSLRLAKFGPVHDAFEARSIEYWRKIFAALPSDPLDWKATKRALSTPLPDGPSGRLVEMAAPSLTGVGDLAARQEAERRLSRTALDLWQGRSPVLPRDPFGKGPLRLRRDAKGWTLWSVGPDGGDDGGKRRGGSGEGHYDLVVDSAGR